MFDWKGNPLSARIYHCFTVLLALIETEVTVLTLWNCVDERVRSTPPHTSTRVVFSDKDVLTKKRKKSRHLNIFSRNLILNFISLPASRVTWL